MKNIIIITGQGGGDFYAITSAIENGVLNNINISKVFSRNDNIVKQSKKLGLNVSFLETKDKKQMFNDIYQYITSNNIDYIILAGFEYLIPSYYFNQLKNKIINSHHSILPANKGLFKKENIINSSQKLLGMTLHYIDENVDEGMILYQVSFPNYGIKQLNKILNIYRFVADVIIVQLLRDLSLESIVENKKEYTFQNILFSGAVENIVLNSFYNKYRDN